MLYRNIESIAFHKEFGRQMRFIVGPRQTGKTTLAKAFLKSQNFSKAFYNWDNRDVKKAYRNNASFFMKDVLSEKQRGKKSWVCFDEIHKIPKWKNVLKGIFDEYEDQCQFIVTGSAKLDLLKYTGESLLGRYFTFRLMPLTLAEITKKSVKNNLQPPPHDASIFLQQILSQHTNAFEEMALLLNHSGFPEPFQSSSVNYREKWQNDYLDHYIKEDLRDLTNIRELENVFNLIELLPSKIGNPLSLNSLKEDLEVSHTSVRNWLKALQLTYVIVMIKPYNKKIIRSVKKEAKCYFFDWTRAKDESQIFENYVCMELLNFCCFATDAGFGDYSLSYVRTREGYETDFLITHKKQPWLLFECKLKSRPIDNHHKKHAHELGDIPLIQMVKEKHILTQESKNHYLISADCLLANLYQWE